MTGDRDHSRRRAVATVVLLGLGIIALMAAAHLATSRRHLLLARSDLEVARLALGSGEADEADAAMRRARSRLLAARASADRFPLSVIRGVPLVGSPARALDGASRAGLHVVAGGQVLAGAAASFPTSSSGAVDAGHLQPIHDAALRSLDAVRETDRHLTAAARILAGPASAMVPPISQPARELRSDVVRRRHQLDGARRGLTLLADVSGPQADVRLLVLSQDSLELRPTGGYIGSYGVLRFLDGAVSLERYDATESLPPPQPPLSAPPDLAPFLPGPWGLSNVNWWADFPTTAEAAADMFRRQGGGDVQGVVALTEHAIGALVGALGPIKVPGYAEPVAEQGLAERIVTEVELKKPQDIPRKRFLIELARVLFDRLGHLPREKVPTVASAFERSAGNGDVQLWFSDAERQRLLEGTAVEGRVPATTGDFLLLTDSNVSASKANLGLVRQAEYRLRRQSDGTLRAQLEVEFHNQAPSSPVNLTYSGYVRLYVPDGARPVDPPRGQRQDRAERGPYQVLSRRIVVPPLERRSMTFDYVLPPSVAPSGRYELTWVRQPGTHRDTFRVVLDGRAVGDQLGGRVSHVRQTIGDRGLAARATERLQRAGGSARWVLERLGLF